MMHRAETFEYLAAWRSSSVLEMPRLIFLL
jgi:hypothetical protein